MLNNQSKLITRLLSSITAFTLCVAIAAPVSAGRRIVVDKAAKNTLTWKDVRSSAWKAAKFGVTTAAVVGGSYYGMRYGFQNLAEFHNAGGKLDLLVGTLQVAGPLSAMGLGGSWAASKFDAWKNSAFASKTVRKVAAISAVSLGTVITVGAMAYGWSQFSELFHNPNNYRAAGNAAWAFNMAAGGGYAALALAKASGWAEGIKAYFAAGVREMNRPSLVTDKPATDYREVADQFGSIGQGIKDASAAEKSLGFQYSETVKDPNKPGKVICQKPPVKKS